MKTGIKKVLTLSEEIALIENKVDLLCNDKNSLVNAWTRDRKSNLLEKASIVREKERAELKKLKKKLILRLIEVNNRIGKPVRVRKTKADKEFFTSAMIIQNLLKDVDAKVLGNWKLS